nr:UDP-N-acetylmuramate dehydrogenase [Apibacter sp. HY039]
MIHIEENKDIKELTTFGVPAYCRFFCEITSMQELEEALVFAQEKELPILMVGGGSNILFAKSWEGLAIHIALKGIREEKPDDNHQVLVTASAGENWHSFVQYCINNNYGGLENLSLIPGNAGTSPMQNIGAYGVEIKDHFYSLKALNIQTCAIETFSNEDCRFGYRDSYFKNEGKNRYVILEVTYRLTSENHHIVTDYGSIKEELLKQGISEPSIKEVSEAVIAIRNSKLPNPKVTGNAGSFFKNPLLPVQQFNSLKEIYPEMPHYEAPENQVKVPAGWLIEKAGWKGKRVGNAGVHDKQALVLVNYGNAGGMEIYNLSENIIRDVNKIFNIHLQREVNIII